MLHDDNGRQTDFQKKMGEIIEGGVLSGIIQLLILASAVAFVLEKEPILKKYEYEFLIVDWVFLGLFATEYIVRIYSAPNRKAFIFSFFGLIDLLAILPALVLIPGFRVLRILRFLRVFRIFKATRFLLAVDRMIDALNKVRRELFALVVLSTLFVYLAACGINYFEETAQPEEFGTITDSMWWAIVSLTTIGYGDVYPITTGGKIFTAFVALVGVGLIAIPSGLLASVLTEARVEEEQTDEKVIESQGTQT